MTARDKYNPGPADADVQKNGDTWTVVLVRELRHSPQKVWQALTDPAQLREWAPFDTDRNLGATGTVAKLTTVGAPQARVTETKVTRADAPRVLEYNWGGSEIRWELEPIAGGTRLTLSASIARHYVAMGAAGWHLCIDVMDHLLGGDPMGRIVGPDAMHFAGWQRLNADYSKRFGIEVPSR